VDMFGYGEDLADAENAYFRNIPSEGRITVAQGYSRTFGFHKRKFLFLRFRRTFDFLDFYSPLMFFVIVFFCFFLGENEDDI
jgi:hypothetical protein